MNIEILEGYEVDVENSDLNKGEIKLKKKTERSLSWEELGEIKGYWVNGSSEVKEVQVTHGVIKEDRNIFATKAQAEASVALAQLTQLMKHIGEGYVVSDCTKYAIYVHFLHYLCSGCSNTTHLLSFNTPVMAHTFLNKHEQLIKQAAPLLWGVEL